MSGKGAFFTPGNKPLFPFFRKKEEPSASAPDKAAGGSEADGGAAPTEPMPLAQGSPMDWSTPGPFPPSEQSPKTEASLPQGWGASPTGPPSQAATPDSSKQFEEVPMAWTPPVSQAPLSWPSDLSPAEPPMTPPTVKADPLPQEAKLMEFSPSDFSGSASPWGGSPEPQTAGDASFLHVEQGLNSGLSDSHPHFEVVQGGAEESIVAPPLLPPVIENSADFAAVTETDSDWLTRMAGEWEPGPLQPIEEDAKEKAESLQEEPPVPEQAFTWDSILSEQDQPASPKPGTEPSVAQRDEPLVAGQESQPPTPAWGAPAWGWPSYAKDDFLHEAKKAEEGQPPVHEVEADPEPASFQGSPGITEDEEPEPLSPAPWQQLSDQPPLATGEDPQPFAYSSDSWEQPAWVESSPQEWPSPGEPVGLVPPTLPPVGGLTPPPLPTASVSQDDEKGSAFAEAASAFQWPALGADAPSEEEVLAHVWRREEEPFGDSSSPHEIPAQDETQTHEELVEAAFVSVPEPQPLAEAEAPNASDRGEMIPPPPPTLDQMPQDDVLPKGIEVQDSQPLSEADAAVMAFDRGETSATPEPRIEEIALEGMVEISDETPAERPLSAHEAALLAFDRGEVAPAPVSTPRVVEDQIGFPEAKPFSDHEAALAAFDRGEVSPPPLPSSESMLAAQVDDSPLPELVLGSAQSWNDSPEWMKTPSSPAPPAASEMIWVDEAPANPSGGKSIPQNPEAVFEAHFEKSIERLFSLNRDFRWKKVGELLQELGLVSDADLAEALSLQAVSKKPLGRILVEQGIISDRLLLKVLAAQKDVVPCFLDAPLEPDLLSLLEPEFCLRCQVLPISQKANVLTLAMRNPSDVDTIDFVAQATGLAVEPGLADEELLAKKIEEAYARDARSHRAHVDALVQEAIKTSDIKVVSIDESKSVQAIEEETRPVSAIVQKLLTEGVKMRASDIHMEPTLRDLQIRYRIDGRLHKVNSVPKELQPMILARVKILAELDPVEWRIPQDGRISFDCEGKVIDLRVSVLPSFYGGRVVMRILDRSIGLKNLEDIGFSDSNLGIFRTLIKRPYGLFLVTGPTGSGKTTSLYAALNEVKDDETNIITCEDPVEYNLEGISQSQVNSKIGLTFAAQLRSILRQDPDVVLVGEIRDHETAETAIRASMTGHLVFSTLHCNDAPSAIPRLLDMNIDPYLLSTSLIGVMGQRLLRRICPECMHDYSPSEEERTILERTFGLCGVEKLYKGKGCVRCAHTGFKGRFAVHEIMPVTHEISSFIAERSATEKLAEVSRFYGYRTMQEDAMERVLRGQTSLKEAQRLLAFDDIPKMDPEAGKLKG